MNRFKEIFLLSIVFILIIWEPFQIFVLKMDGAGRIPLTLSIIGIILSFPRSNIFSKPIIYYLLWFIFVFFNSLNKGIDHFEYFISFFSAIFLPFAMLIISTKLSKGQTIKISLVYVIIAALYVYISFAYFYEGRNDSERLGDMLNANAVGMRSGFIILFAIILYAMKKINLLYLILLLPFPLFVSIATGSRTTAVVSFFFLISLLFINLRSKIRLRTLIINFIILFAIFQFATYVLYDTYVGDRLLMSSLQVKGTEFQTGTILDNFGDRGFQYYESWPIILKNPLTGIGLKNYLDYTITNHIFHSEYLTQLCENGLIGFILYYSFFIWILKGLIKIRPQNDVMKRSKYILVSGVLGILILSFATRVSYYPFYYALIGIAINFILYYSRSNRVSI